MLGKSSLTFSELETAVIEVEAIINSRPLTFVYNDINEPEPLTPGHFLIGRRLVTLPFSSSILPPSTKTNLKVKWKHKQAILERISKKWQSSYLLELRSAHQCLRIKGTSEQIENSTVLVYEERLPRLMWKMGIVVNVHPGRDGKIRACTIKLPNRIFLKRPIQLLYPVELNIDSKGPDDCLSNGPLGPEDETD